MTPPISSAHCSDDALGDWIDGRLDADAREAVARHCATCTACAGRAAALRRVVDAARRAPAVLLPPDPDALERAITAAIRARSARPTLHVASHTESRVPPKRAMATVWRSAALRIAAVLALMAMTAAITARLVRRAPPPDVAVTHAPHAAREETPAPVRPAADVAALRVETDRTLAVLRAAAATGDRVLAAETLRALERSLATIDAAIAEADAALARDPGNAALAELLSRTYARKRELVRRGASLGSRS